VGPRAGLDGQKISSPSGFFNIYCTFSSITRNLTLLLPRVLVVHSHTMPSSTHTCTASLQRCVGSSPHTVSHLDNGLLLPWVLAYRAGTV